MPRRNVYIGVLSVMMLLLIGGVTLLQQAGVVQGMPAPQRPAGLTIPYAGHLSGVDGKATVDGTYALTLALYSTLSGGEPLWSETQESVTVRAGDFVVALGSVNALPAEVLSGQVWLEVGVRGPADVGFTTLSPRQVLDLVPPDEAGTQAGACAHDHWGETWEGTGRGLGLTGTFTNNPILSIMNFGAGEGLRAYGNGTLPDDAAVTGISTSGTGSGIYGQTDSGAAVFGQSRDVGGTGVWGENTDSAGGTGVLGRSLGTVGAVGVAGQALSTACFAGDGGCYGVRGVSNEGIGVEGYTEGGVGVHAITYGNGAALQAEETVGGDLITAYHGGMSADLRFLVDDAGEVYADGTFHTPTPGFAQMLPGAPGLEAGDVLVLGVDGQVARCTAANQTAVVGIYAPDAGFIASAGVNNVPVAGQVPVLMMGVVPVKVSAENGPILPGDLLVTAATPGYAMKATPITVNGVTFYPSGIVLGKALEPLASGTGTISVLVTLK